MQKKCAILLLIYLGQKHSNRRTLIQHTGQPEWNETGNEHLSDFEEKLWCKDEGVAEGYMFKCKKLTFAIYKTLLNMMQICWNLKSLLWENFISW